MKNFKLIYIVVLFHISFNVFGQNAEQKHLERSNLKNLEGIWYGTSEMGGDLRLDLKFAKIYYEKGSFLVDQLIGDVYLKTNNNSGEKKVLRIDGVEVAEQNGFSVLKFQGFDLIKEKSIELQMKMSKLDSLSGELELKNKETWVINGKAGGKEWDPEFSIHSFWNLVKQK
jgi:hypothetical protein